jgi:diketogulonate reductase-like aldo/keto reductase
MPLRSKHFKDNPKLQACLISHAAHVTLGASGEHVARIQHAVITIEGCAIDTVELQARLYGQSTADAVLRYKSRRGVINRTYQNKADNIVGKMTIASLDEDMLRREREASHHVVSSTCNFDHKRPAS